MRIVHTCLRYPPATGGVETYVREIVERTRDITAGRDVRVLTSSMRTHGPISLLDPKLLLDDPPYVQRTHTAATPGLSYPRLQGLAYYLQHHQPDIVHGYSYWYHPADVAARFAKKNRLPFIFHPIFYTNAQRKKIGWRIYQQIMGRATFAAADVVAVISPYEQKLIETAGLPVRRFVLLPPGVDTTALAQAKSNPFVGRGIVGPVLLCVGRLAASKGIDEAIRVFARIQPAYPTAQLVIIGEDFGDQALLQKLAGSLHLKNVHFWGKVPREILEGAYQHAFALLHPSHYEAFGITVAEALAAGTPVIARNTAAIPYVAPRNTAGLLFTTEEQFQKSLETLLSSPTLAAKLGSQGQQYVRQNFTWDRTIQKLLGLYNELILE